MRYAATPIPGVIRIDIDPVVDERGMFARLYCPDDFAGAGISFSPGQINLSRNVRAHTLRGMHYQDPPYAESKLVRVVQGAIHDVVIDLRPISPTFRAWTAVTLTAEHGEALFIPEGCAHGFLTLEDDVDVLYHMGRKHEPGKGKGVRWDDPTFGVAWPAAPAVIDKKDREWPNFIS